MLVPQTGTQDPPAHVCPVLALQAAGSAPPPPASLGSALLRKGAHFHSGGAWARPQPETTHQVVTSVC